MNYLLTQILLCLIAAFILGFIIGWLWRHITCKKCQDEVLELKRKITEHKKEIDKTPTKVAVVKQKPEIVEKIVVAKEAPKIEINNVEEVAENGMLMPKFLTEPRNGKADELKRIKGIGKVLEATLFDKGVYHFEQIANWSPEHAKWMDNFMQFPGRIGREGWVNQAKLLAKGGETEFSKKVDENKIYD